MNAAGCMDFGFSLGVLHHVPDTAAGIRDCVCLLKKGAPFLVYLYYRFDDRPAWFRGLWRASDVGRRIISKLPDRSKHLVCDIVAATTYWPMARMAAMGERIGIDPTPWPLSFYRDMSFYTMRTDALDRFGTRLEQRFTKPEIAKMMTDAGLKEVKLSHFPKWCAVGIKA